MEQYISKSALVAEIERRTDELYNLLPLYNFLPDSSKVENGTITISEVYNTGRYTALESFKDYINTIEVKEVDLKEEIDFYIESSLTGTNPIYTKGTVSCIIEKTAKHFFELGIQIGNKAQKGD